MATSEKSIQETGDTSNNKSSLKLKAYGINVEAVFDGSEGSDTVEENLGLFERARKAGKINSPHHSEENLSADERDIVSYYKNIISITENKIHEALLTLRASFNETEIKARTFLPNLATEVQAVKDKANMAMAKNRLRLKEKYYNYAESKRDLNYFKDRNGLTSDAIYPESKMLHIGILAIFIVIETLANALLFSEANNQGLFGGIMIAAMISMINVIGSFFIGYLGVRYLFVKNRNIKMFASVGSLFFLANIVLLLLTAAHYRDILEQNINVPMTSQITDAFGNAVNSPVDFQTFHSFALLVFGVIISAISIWKGVTIDSYFPGYGNVSRKFENFESDYQEYKHKVYDECYDLINNSNTTAGELVADVNETIVMYRELPILYEYLKEKYQNFLKQQESECHALLKRYRERNQLIRTDRAPEYFSEFPSIVDEYSMIEESIEIDEELVDDLKEKMSLIYGQLDQAKKSLYKELDEELVKFVESVEAIESKIEEDIDQELLIAQRA